MRIKRYFKYNPLWAVVMIMLGFFFLAQPAWAAVTLDGAVSSSTLASGTSISFSHTTGTGTDRLMLVGVSWNSNTAATSISSVTFTPSGGSATALSVVVTRKHSSQNRYSAIYSLLAPPSGVTGTVAITFSANVSAGIMTGAANFTGAHQTTTFGTTNYADGQSTAASVTLTGLTGDELVMDNIFQGASASSQTLTIGAGQTQLWYPSYVANLRAAASIEQAAGASVTMSWTAATSSYWVIVAVPIKPSAPSGPTVTINQASGQADPTATSPINYTVVFNESVTGFATGDVTLGGTAGATTGTVTEIAPNDGTTYNVAVSGMTGSGTVIATIAAGVAQNGSAQNNAASTSSDNTVTYDVTGPDVTINQASGQADPTGASPINFTVVFSEAVTDFATGDVTLSGTAGATTGTVTGSGTTYNVAVSGMTGSGTVIAAIGAGVASDALGNANTASTSADNSVTYDDIAPTVTIDQASGQADPTSASPITFTVVFSEAVADFATGDVVLSGSTAPGTLTGTVTGSGTTYSVAVSGMTGSGSVVATIASGAAHDGAGNSNQASTSTDNTVTFEYVAPTLYVDGAVSSGTANAGNSSVSFSHTTGTGTNRLMLVGVSWNCGTTDRTISAITFTPEGGSAVNLTEVKTQQYTWTTNNYRYTAIYSLLNPASGVTGTMNITFSGAVSNGIIAGAANFAGVDQTTPLGTPSGTVGTGTSSSGTPNPALTLTGLTGNELIFDSVFIGASATTHTMTADAGQSEAWNILGYSSTTTSFNMRGAASTEQATGTSATMSWTTGGYGTTATRWAIAAVPINPAPTAVTYDLTMAVNPTGGGTTNPAVGIHTYNEDTVVDISATAATGYHFVNWTGDVADPNSATTTVTMSGDKTVTANFALNTYTLTVTIVGNGSVSKDPDQASYTHGTSVSLTATADPGWTFAGWSGDLTGTENPKSITMDGNKTVTATFTQNAYTLTVTVVGNGTVSKDPDQASYTHGTSVSLTATADPGWTFAGWSGDLTGTENPKSITMDGNKTVTATFTQNTYTLTVTVVGNGSVSKDPDQASYTHGTSVSLTATADPGWTFAGWSGDLTGTENPKSITMDANKTVTATFTQNTYTLTVTVVGNGSVSKDPDQASYTHGTSVSLTATADPGWTFAGWSGDLTGTENPKSITMDGNKTVTATFTQNTYTLTVTVVGNGSVSKDPDQASYTHGTSVSLTATADPGWTFAGWTGDLVSVNNPESIIMNGNKSVTATFTQNQYALVVNITGNGTVAKVPDQGLYNSGSEVQLTATPAAGWTFAGWSGDLTGTENPKSITMDGNKTVIATFTQNAYTLTVTVVGNGTVSKDPDQASYTHGTSVSLTATADPGWTFAGWSGDLTGTENPKSITMDGNKTVTATFTQNTYTLTVTVVGNGSVSKDPDQASYTHGTSVSLTATADPGWTFAGWSGDMTGTENPKSITMDANKTVTATFTQNTYTLTVTVVGNGSVSKDPDQASYTHGTSVSLTATADPGWTFAGWSGDMTGTENPKSITMDGNKTVTATFTQNQYTLTATSGGNGTVTLNPEGGTYASGTTVTLTPNPAVGYQFSSWSGDNAGDIVNTGGVFSIEMNGNKSVQANFSQLNYTLTVIITGSGSVTKNPDAPTYTHGNEVTLTAIPAAGWEFVGWSGGLVSTNNPAVVTMDGNKTVTATFAKLGLLGDAYRDESINSTDALIVLSCDVGINTSDFCPMNCGDCNSDGLVNSTDALLILTYGVGMSVPFPVGQPGCPTNVAPCQGCLEP